MATIELTSFVTGEGMTREIITVPQNQVKKQMSDIINQLKSDGYTIFQAVYACDMYLSFNAYLDNGDYSELHTYEVKI